MSTEAELQACLTPKALADLMTKRLGDPALAAAYLRSAADQINESPAPDPVPPSNKRPREDDPTASTASQLAAALAKPEDSAAVASSETHVVKAGCADVPSAACIGFLGGVPGEDFDNRETALVMIVPHAGVRYVIGKGGQSLRAVEQHAGLDAIKIQKDSHADPNSLGRLLTLIGNTRSVTVGAYLVMRTLHETCGRQIYPDWCKRAILEANKPLSQPMSMPHVAMPGQVMPGHMPPAAPRPPPGLPPQQRQQPQWPQVSAQQAAAQQAAAQQAAAQQAAAQQAAQQAAQAAQQAAYQQQPQVGTQQAASYAQNYQAYRTS